MKKHFLFAAVVGLMTFAACSDDDPVKPEPPQQEDTEQPGDKPGEDPGDQPGEEPNGGVSQSAVSSIIRTDKGEQLLLTGLAGVLEDGESSVWTMAYDDQGRITLASVTEEEETEAFKLSYEPFKIEFPEEYRYTDEYDRERVVILSGTLNAKGYLSSLTMDDYLANNMEEPYFDTSVNLEYDEEGHLIKAKNSHDRLHNWDGFGDPGTWTFTWKDGLLTEANFVAQSDLSTVEERYEIAQNKNENKYNQYTVGLSEITGTGPLALAGLLGKGPDQFIGWYNYTYKKYEGDYLLTEERESLGHRYEVNEDGTLAKETSYIMATGGPAPIVDEYTYTYSPFGSAAKKTSAAPAWAKKTTKGRLPFQPRGMAR